MTASLISPVGSVKSDSLVGSAKQGAKANDSTFQDMLSTSTKSQESKPEVKQTKTEKIEKNNTVKDTKKTEKVESKKVDNQKETDEIPAEVAENIQSQITEVVAKELDVTPEELLDALNELGLEPIDLLDNTVLPAVVAKVNGEDDMLAIATDENLYEAVVEVSELVNDIKGDIDVTDERFDDFIGKVKEASAETLTENNVPEVKVDKEMSKDNDGANNQMSNQTGEFVNQILENIKDAVAARSEAVESYTTSVEDIYNQIEQSLKVNLTKEVSELEINLHPASLGNVKINLASKDGMITANFVTQNETVKAAVEAQLVELKQNFEEQGLKVNEIEVTVASHAFDENLSQNSGETSQDDFATPKRRRTINLNDITDAELELDEEEELAREMMAANGNTVDYMA